MSCRQFDCWGYISRFCRKVKIAAEGSPEQMDLRLTGLVTEYQGKLRTFNRIYESVFNSNWVTEKLTSLRPPAYAAALTVWLASNRQRNSLLQGQALENAQEWASGKSLSNQDYQFFSGEPKE